jgi:hypothetical protein
MTSRRKKEHERKVRRKRSFGKTELDGKIWLISSPHKSGNIRGRRRKTQKKGRIS